MPEATRQALRALHAQLGAVHEAAAGLEEAIVAHARRHETARRLATIPGVGPITASLIAATVTDIGAFKRARDFAAWLGRVPRQHSTGGKARLGRITKAGNPEIRTLLVLGATSMMRRAGQWNSAAGTWVRGILARRPARLATVALASKMARVAPPAALPQSASRSERGEALALTARKEDYCPSGRGTPATVAGATA